MADDPVADVGKYVADEYAKEWQRKGSLETRALALATANVAVATFVTAWIDRLDALPPLSHGQPRVLMLLAASMSLLSVGFSMTAAIAFTYQSPRSDALKSVIEKAEAGGKGVSSVIARAYWGQLASARTANDKKFTLIGIGLVLLFVAATTSVSTLTAVLWP